MVQVPLKVYLGTGPQKKAYNMCSVEAISTGKYFLVEKLNSDNKLELYAMIYNIC